MRAECQEFFFSFFMNEAFFLLVMCESSMGETSSHWKSAQMKQSANLVRHNVHKSLNYPAWLANLTQPAHF